MRYEYYLVFSYYDVQLLEQIWCHGEVPIHIPLPGAEFTIKNVLSHYFPMS